MDRPIVNFTTETSTNSTARLFGRIGNLEICVYSLTVLFGLPTHSYLIFLIVTGGSEIVEFFNLNLSVCEIGVCVNCFFFVLTVCCSGFYNLSLFLQGLVITGRPLFQCLICVERYLAVVHPVTFLKFKPLRYRAMCSAAAWIISLSSCLCCILTLVLLTIEIYTCFFLLQFLVFLSVQLFCCVAVLRALKQSGPGKRGKEREEKNNMKRQAFYLILITTVTTVIIYVSNIILGMFVIFKAQLIYGCWFMSLICYALAGFVQPVLYLYHAGKLFCLSHF